MWFIAVCSSLIHVCLKNVKMLNCTVLVSMEAKIVQHRHHSIFLQYN